MPVILHKTKTTVGSVSSAAPSFDSLINMSDAEFSAMQVKDRQALKDQIDRHTTAAMLGITIRTLQRWHHHQYGPKRLSGTRVRYSRAEVEAWIAKHGQGSHRPRSTTKSSVPDPGGQHA
jgi:predicted DNA-binding transcriptional regulator AlpA